ncbi:MAG: retropepsin-like aspartic protease [Cyanobacteriota bacterium]|nr:retropepsin-like aspartic protease [Cyanobacteriota bacterium]
MVLIVKMKKLAIALTFLSIILIGIKLETLPKNKSAIAIPQQSKKQQIDTQQLKAIVQLEGLNLPRPKVTGKATIPLKVLDGGKVFVATVNIGGKPADFLLDTGASTSMLSSEIVKQLNLSGEPIPQELLNYAVAGDECPSMRANLHTFPVLEVDEVRVEGLMGLEFSTAVIPADLSGVLGMDFLSHFDLNLNPQRRELKLLPPAKVPEEKIASTIALKSRLGVMLAEVEINGIGPFTLMLDTGAESTFISQELALLLKIDGAAKQPVQVQGFCGLEMAEIASLAKVKLGSNEETNLEAVILSSPVLQLLNVDGILGQNFLNNYEQSWRFGESQQNELTKEGSLLLIPLEKDTETGKMPVLRSYNFTSSSE